MSAISPRQRSPRKSSLIPAAKPPVKGGATEKLIRLAPSELRKIERAAATSEPPMSASWFIVQAAVARAEALLGAA